MLHSAGIPMVVASHFPLTKEGGLFLTRKLYSALTSGQDPRAFLHGIRRDLHDLNPRSFDWASLLVYAEFPTDLEQQLEKIREFQFRKDQPIQTRPMFISYSHADTDFVDKLELALCHAGIDAWRDVHDATVGPLEEQVSHAMANRLVLVVLSKASTASDWVEHEVREARRIAKEQNRHVFVPIRLDDSWKTCPWPQRLKEQVEEYKILNFSDWQKGRAFEESFQKLKAGIRKWYT
jgi:hypothetical protein